MFVLLWLLMAWAGPLLDTAQSERVLAHAAVQEGRWPEADAHFGKARYAAMEAVMTAEIGMDPLELPGVVSGPIRVDPLSASSPAMLVLRLTDDASEAFALAGEADRSIAWAGRRDLFADDDSLDPSRLEELAVMAEQAGHDRGPYDAAAAEALAIRARENQARATARDDTRRTINLVLAGSLLVTLFGLAWMFVPAILEQWRLPWHRRADLANLSHHVVLDHGPSGRPSAWRTSTSGLIGQIALVWVLRASAVGSLWGAWFFWQLMMDRARLDAATWMIVFLIWLFVAFAVWLLLTDLVAPSPTVGRAVTLMDDGILLHTTDGLVRRRSRDDLYPYEDIDAVELHHHEVYVKGATIHQHVVIAHNTIDDRSICLGGDHDPQRALALAESLAGRAGLAVGWVEG